MAGPTLSRRAVLGTVGAVTAGTAIAGCRFDPATPSAAPQPTPTPDPDARLVTNARAELVGLIDELGDAAGTAALVATHQTQLVALGGRHHAGHRHGGPVTPTQVSAREHTAADRFAGWAASASSGELARLFASISAGIRMQPAVAGAAS